MSLDELPLWSNPAPTALSVWEVTAAVAEAIAQTLPDELTVQGEISNYKHHASGHMYFSLKDERATLRCVFFHGDNARLRFTPADGMRVVAVGRLGVYPPQGSYQLYVKSLSAAGQGELMAALERLKRRLAAEGLFDNERKKELPPYPAAVGVVTSPSGAAVRDIINVLSRRWPGLRIILRPTLVQGPGAAADIAAAIKEFNAARVADVLIVGRGGGSLEDLWAFNEEETVRAIAASRVPIISAVGHETDWTLADLAADLRAPTPSAAAELAVPLKQECVQEIRGLKRDGAVAVSRWLDDARQEIAALKSSYGFRLIPQRLADKRQTVDENADRAARAARIAVARKRETFARAAATLRALSPTLTLRRGYAVVTTNGAVVKSVTALGRRARLSLHFHDGDRSAVVTDEEEGA